MKHTLRLSFWAAALCLLSVLALAGVAAGQAASAPSPDLVKIDNIKTFRALSKPPVQFSHAKHIGPNQIKCQQCHHRYENKQNLWKEGDKVQRCVECHTSATANREGGMLALMNAYHQNCRYCHEAQKKGPVKCDDCHVKQ